MFQAKAKEMITKRRTAEGSLDKFGSDFIEQPNRASLTGIARFFLGETHSTDACAGHKPFVAHPSCGHHGHMRLLFFLFVFLEKFASQSVY
jgi:hypothetical protein